MIAIGALALNMTLADVHQTRTEFGHVSKPPTQCLIGVPYSQRHWLDHEVWAWDGQRVYGPMLVVDIEAAQVIVSGSGHLEHSVVAALTRLGYPPRNSVQGAAAVKAKAKSFVSCAIGRMSD